METSKKQKGERKDMWRIIIAIINVILRVLAIVMWMAIAVIIIGIALAGGLSSC
jgi:hypothetical protein